MLQNFKNGYEVSEKSEIARNEKNDCAVRAIANAFRINYNMAHVFVNANFNRKKGKGTKDFTSILKQLSAAPITFEPSVYLMPIRKHFQLITLVICQKEVVN